MTAAEYGEWDFGKTLSVAKATAENTPLYAVTPAGITHLRNLMDSRYAMASSLSELTDAEIDGAWESALQNN